MTHRENDRGRVGRIGEDTASRFLVRKGYGILQRNYRKKWGEIDIVAKKGSVLHFVEVKTVSRENLEEAQDGFRAEENVHPAKLKRLVRAIETYLAEKDREESWVIDVVAIDLDLRHKRARVRFLENVIV